MAQKYCRLSRIDIVFIKIARAIGADAACRFSYIDTSRRLTLPLTASQLKAAKPKTAPAADW
jgi:hypothetical protein